MFQSLVPLHFSATLIFSLLFLQSIKFGFPKRMYALYSSDLQDLERFELRIAEHIRETNATFKNCTGDSNFQSLLEAYLLDFYESNGLRQAKDAILKKENYASENPICTYRLVRRVHSLLQDLASHEFFCQIFSALCGQVKSFFLASSWPNVTDVLQTAATILRLQQVYELKAEQLANGWVSEFPTKCTLNSDHCIQLAGIANSSFYYALAIEWFEQAKEKALIDKKTNIEDIDSSLKNVIHMHNQGVDGRFGYEPRFFTRKIRAHIPGDSKTVKTKRTDLYEFCKGMREPIYNLVQFWGLCSGKKLQTEKEKSYLFCWYEFKIHPSLAIGPIKMEFLTRNPDVVQMYEVLKENLTDTIKLETGSGMRESGVVGQGIVSTRLSVTAWYSGTHNDALKQKIGRLTGLNLATDNGEKFQVVSYATGGQYEPHMDVDHNGKDMVEDRMATFMFYLNDVGKGGSTAFASLGVAAQPILGSAVYWHNTLLDGTADVTTWHAACPVVIGEKLIMNKWISVKDQFLARKCGLKPTERFRIPVNNVYLPIPEVFKRDVEIQPITPPPQENVLSKYSYETPQGLQALAKVEQMSIYPFIKNVYHLYRNRTSELYREEFDIENKDVKNYLDKFEETAIEVTGLDGGLYWGEKEAHNPLTAFKMIRRFIDYFQNWITRRPHSDTKLLTKIRSYLRTVYNESDGPGVADIETAMFTIINIAFTYDLSAKNISEGILDGVDTRIKLTAKDCALIGQHATVTKFYTVAFEWLEHALNLVKNNLTTDSDNIAYEDIYDALLTSEISHDEDVLKPEWEQNPKFFTEPISQGLDQLSSPTQRKSKKSLQYKESENKKYSLSRFSGICNGRFRQTDSELSKLFCWYEREIHPTYKIGPIKSEFLSIHEGVEVVQYHDVISDAVITSLTNLTHLDFERFSYNDVTRSYLQRQSTTMTVGESDAPKNLLQLAQRLTGLKSKNKPYQDRMVVSAYTPGGYFGERLEKTRGTLASFMFHLSDVERGGDTVFLNSGAKAVPKKGSVIFWYNRYSSGRLNKLTLYGDCPVIFGVKWTVFWLAPHDPQNHLQCHLEPLKSPEVLVNGKSKSLENTR